jgi:hypothetical protein
VTAGPRHAVSVDGRGITLDDLVGRWRRTGDHDPSAPYPQELEFFLDRTYRGTSAGPRRPIWDEASFDVLPDGSLRIRAADDSSMTVAARRSGDVLTLVAGEDRVSYRRVLPAGTGRPSG